MPATQPRVKGAHASLRDGLTATLDPRPDRDVASSYEAAEERSEAGREVAGRDAHQIAPGPHRGTCGSGLRARGCRAGYPGQQTRRKIPPHKKGRASPRPFLSHVRTR